MQFTFTPQAASYIRQLLGQRPYDEVAPLIADMERQVNEQQAAAVADAQPVSAGAKDNGATAAVEG